MQRDQDFDVKSDHVVRKMVMDCMETLGKSEGTAAAIVAELSESERLSAIALRTAPSTQRIRGWVKLFVIARNRNQNSEFLKRLHDADVAWRKSIDDTLKEARRLEQELVGLQEGTDADQVDGGGGSFHSVESASTIS